MGSLLKQSITPCLGCLKFAVLTATLPGCVQASSCHFSDGSDPYECCETTARYKIVPGTYMPSQNGLLFCTPCKEAHAEVFSGQLQFRDLLPRLQYKPSVTEERSYSGSCSNDGM